MVCGNDKKQNLYYCECSYNDFYNNFPDIKVQIGNNVYSITKDSYVVKVKYFW